MSEEKMFDDIQMDLHNPTLDEELYVKVKLRTILALSFSMANIFSYCHY